MKRVLLSLGLIFLAVGSASASRFGVTTDLATGVSTFTLPGTYRVYPSSRSEVVIFEIVGGSITIAQTITANKFIGSASDLTNIATGTFNSIGVDTAALRAELNSAVSRADSVAVATTAINASTTSLQSQVNTLGIATSSLRTDLTSASSRADSVAVATTAINASTTSLRADITSVISRADAVAVATGAINASTTSLQSQVNSLVAGSLPIIVSTNIAKDAVTHVGGSNSGALGPNTSITSLSFTTTGSTIVVLASWSGSWTVDGSNEAYITVQVDRAGNTIAGGNGICRAKGLGASSTYACTVAINTIDTPVAGTYTYNLTYNLIAGSSLSTGASNLTLFELKR